MRKSTRNWQRIYLNKITVKVLRLTFYNHTNLSAQFFKGSKDSSVTSTRRSSKLHVINSYLMMTGDIASVETL